MHKLPQQRILLRAKFPIVTELESVVLQVRSTNRLCVIVGFIKFPAKIRVINTSTTQDPSLEVIVVVCTSGKVTSIIGFIYVILWGTVIAVKVSDSEEVAK